MAIGIEKSAGFYLNRRKPLDVKTQVASATERFTLKFVFKGLIVNQKDDAKRYLYTGDEISNTSGDWIVIPQLYTGTTVPANSLGAVDDIYINETTKTYYRKTGTTTWTALFVLSGAQIFTSIGTPSNGTGLDGDLNVDDAGNVYEKESGVWDLKFNIAGADGTDGDRYATSSSTPINLDSASDPITITVETGLAYTIGQQIEIVSSANLANNITTEVQSYNTGTGQLTVTNSTINGTGTHSDWKVNLAGAPGRQGKAFIHTESDINFTQSKVTSVEAGSWTAENPWSASILNDSRTAGELTATPGIVGNKAGHSIAYDGVAWKDNGTWRGPKGDKGDTGNTGSTGPAGPPGASGLAYKYIDIVAGSPTLTVLNETVPQLIKIRATQGKTVQLSRAAAGSLIAISPVPLNEMTIQTEDVSGHTSQIIYGTFTYSAGSNFLIGGGSPTQAVLLLVREDSPSLTVYEVISDVKGGTGASFGIKVLNSVGYGDATGSPIAPLTGKSYTSPTQLYMYKITTRTLRIDVTMLAASKAKTGGFMLIRMILQELVSGIWTDRGSEDFMLMSNCFDAPGPGGSTIVNIPQFTTITGTFLIYPSTTPGSNGSYRVILASNPSNDSTPVDGFFVGAKIKYVFHPIVV
jgi:hypothetical protein